LNDRRILVSLPLQAAQMLVEMADELEELSEGEAETLDDVRHRIDRAIHRKLS
jgi:hypothetical protein